MLNEVTSPVSNIKSIGQRGSGLRLPKIGGFPLTLNVALTTVLRTNVLHCDNKHSTCRQAIERSSQQMIFENVFAVLGKFVLLSDATV